MALGALPALMLFGYVVLVLIVGSVRTHFATSGGPTWNISIEPGATNDTVGFCADRGPLGNAITSVATAMASY